MDKLVIVNVYRLRIDAEIDKGLLTVNGIKSIISADDAGATNPFPMSYSFGVKLKVNVKDLEKAKRLLKIPKEK